MSPVELSDERVGGEGVGVKPNHTMAKEPISVSILYSLYYRISACTYRIHRAQAIAIIFSISFFVLGINLQFAAMFPGL